MNSSVTNIAVIIWCIIAYLLFFIFLNWTYSYWSLSNYIIAPISLRNPFIPKIISVLTLIAIFVDPIFILAQYGFIGNDMIFALKMYGVIAYPLRIIPMYLISYRLWMTYYNIKVQKLIDQNEWQTDNDNDHQSFFIKYRSSLGHKKRALYFTILLSIPTIVLIVILRWFYGSDRIRPLTTLIFFLPLIISLILVCICPEFDDVFKIRKEVKYSSLAMSFIMFSVFVIRTLIPTGPPQFEYLFVMIMAISMPISMQITVIYYPLKSYNLPTNALWARKYAKNQTAEVTRQIISGHNDENKEDENDLEIEMVPQYLQIPMAKVLENDQGFDLFARHLSHEFAVELILFFVETQQYIKYILSDKDVQSQYGNLDDHKVPNPVDDASGTDAVHTRSDNKTTADESNSQIDYWFDRLIRINLPNSAPKSVIVNKKNNPDPKEQCIDIYNKYIANHATLPINVSGEIRNELSRKIGNIDNLDGYELVHVWDEARYQIYGDLENSFDRFNDSDIFKENYKKFMS